MQRIKTNQGDKAIRYLKSMLFIQYFTPPQIQKNDQIDLNLCNSTDSRQRL